jgi:hypothetical protein
VGNRTGKSINKMLNARKHTWRKRGVYSGTVLAGWDGMDALELAYLIERVG